MKDIVYNYRGKKKKTTATSRPGPVQTELFDNSAVNGGSSARCGCEPSVKI